VEYLASLPFDGFAIGGSLGKDRAEMVDLLEWLLPHVPTHKPNHLLGIADEESIEACVPFGIDTFDSCNPTRIARHGNLLTSEGVIRIKNLKYVDDFGPIDPQLETVPYTRAYLHHLIKQNEPLFASLVTEHNLYFMNNLMKTIREKIMRDEI
jgi:queuine tRNA-ribosyltransferase